MTKIIDKLSVFFPAYNEEKCIEDTVLKADKVLKEIVLKDYEIIIINDGSKDKTGEISDKLAKKLKKIKVIHHNPNRGYGGALKSGLYAARFPWIAFTDSDGQFDFSEIIKLIDFQKETKADMVVGYYLKRAVPFYRKLNSFIWQQLVGLFFGLRVKDIDCGFKLFKKEVVEKIPSLESERGAFITTEFLIKTKKAGFKIKEIGVSHFPDIAGGSTGASFKVIISSFIDLFKLWGKLR
jgi:glycosyltransferase involved in cell wall biosynthesis